MSVFSKFEDKVGGAVEGAAGAVFKSPIEPAQIAKRAEKQMKREKLIGSGRQYAPTLYNVLVNPQDDKRLFGFYPTLASEIENYLYAKGTEAGMEFDTRPLVRFIVDKGLKSSKFDVIAENVSAPIIQQLREEEQEYYGIKPKPKSVENPRQGQLADDRVDSLDSGLVGGLVGGLRPDVAAPARVAIPLVSEPLNGLDSSDGFNGSNGSNGFNGANDFNGSNGSDGLDVAVRPQESATQQAIGNSALFNVTESRKIRLDIRKMTAGRGQDNSIVLADANASRVHLLFSQDATGKWKLTDLNSTNGTLLNGKPVKQAILRDGDEVTIGTTLLEFRQ